MTYNTHRIPYEASNTGNKTSEEEVGKKRRGKKKKVDGFLCLGDGIGNEAP